MGERGIYPPRSHFQKSWQTQKNCDDFSVIAAVFSATLMIQPPRNSQDVQKTYKQVS